MEKYVQIMSLREANEEEVICASYPKPSKNVSGKKTDEKMIKAENDAKEGLCKLLVWRKVEETDKISYERSDDFEISYRNEQIADLKAILAGTITENGEYNSSKGTWEINCSSILTRLIQEAGRWCEYYASDLFVQWKYDIEQKLDNGTLETNTFVFAMYNSGVHREDQYEQYKKQYRYDNSYYRAVWFLDVETNEGKIKMVLHK